MFEYYNPNPRHQNVGDCTIRALSKALDQPWENTFAGLTTMAYALADMPSANHVWGAYLRKHGYKRYIVDDNEVNTYTIEDFCKDNPKGTYVLGMAGHVACVKDGVLYDTWDSSGLTPIYYWKRG